MPEIRGPDAPGGHGSARSRLRAGIVGRPHGLDGSFYVSQPSPQLLLTGAVVMIAEQDRRITRRAGTDARPIIKLEDCDDRASAQQLGGQELLVARDRAPELEDDEWWAEDLEGCSVRDGDRRIGTVTRLLALPSCEVLEVARSEGGADLLVPLIVDAVRGVDLGSREIDVDLRFLGEA